METEDDEDDEESEAVHAQISEEEEEEGADQTESDPLPASQLEERIPTSELTDEEAQSQEDPDENGECNECPPSESVEESELILSPGFYLILGKLKLLFFRFCV